MVARNLAELKNRIKTEANNLGFSHIGFSDPKPGLSFPHFENWLKAGYAADMHYLSRTDTIVKRKDPKLILPGVQSIISFALPYIPTSQIPSEGQPEYGRVASYAIGKDYHEVIPPLLKKIIDFIQNSVQKTVEYRIYTDTGPILERAFAQQAGLGWIGKNSCLIIPGFGSYVFLAEILINLPFEADLPFGSDLCGSCTRCIQSCPTGCILDNKTIDANKCISYLTIENKNEIPENLREKIGEWIFGCDICQQVCPWNVRFASPPDHNYFSAPDQYQYLDLLNLDIYQQDTFSLIFKDSPVTRAKRKGFLRNVSVVIGNLQDTKFLPILEELAINESEFLVKVHVIWALSQFNHEYAKTILLKMLGREKDEILKAQISQYIH